MANGYNGNNRGELIDQFKKLKAIDDRLDLQQLQQLQQLERLERLQQLEVKNQSYLDMFFDKKSAVIYCDPPYEGTAVYQENQFVKNDFCKWALAQDLPVFISEYKMPSEFKKVASFIHKSTLSATNNSKVTTENLYWNGVYFSKK